MELKYDDRGLIPAIVQDSGTGQVLMLAYMNAEALAETVESGETWFWSRSQQTLWHKGATSGNVQIVEEMRYDCDADALLVRVHPAGPACHTGEQSCFYRSFPAHISSPETTAASPLSSDPYPLAGEKKNSRTSQPLESEDYFSLQQLYQVIQDRRQNPIPGSHTASLFAAGLPKIAQKVGEEAAEVLVAALAQEDQRLVEEVADLAYHLLVLLAARGLTPFDVTAELARRHQPAVALESRKMSE
jgi:phosphoribosyl-ATP pyrophosphohydrolase/phosphoribosyl-AMP cyclohydrolase